MRIGGRPAPGSLGGPQLAELRRAAAPGAGRAPGGRALPKIGPVFSQIQSFKGNQTLSGSLTYEDTEAASVDSKWERQVMRWCLWTRPLPPPSILCVSSVASSTGQEKTIYTITRMKWTMTWSATSAFSLCCSHWILPVDTRSAASASETSYKRKISVH